MVLVSVALSSDFGCSQVFAPAKTSLNGSDGPSVLSSESVSRTPRDVPYSSAPQDLPFLVLGSPNGVTPVITANTFVPTQALKTPRAVYGNSPRPVFAIIAHEQSTSKYYSAIEASPAAAPMGNLTANTDSSASEPDVIG